MSPLAALRREGEEVVSLARRILDGEDLRASELAGASLLAPMVGAPHDPVHHAEGDPATHTAMVVRGTVDHPAFDGLPGPHRFALVLAALLHDCAKPETTDVVDGRVGHPGHSSRGAKKARSSLYAAGVDPWVREAVATLCRRHMQPHHALERGDDVSLLRWVAAISVEVPFRLLTVLAHADATGRLPARNPEVPALLEAFAEEHGVLDGPWEFADANARRSCFRDEDRDPRWPTGVPEEGPTLTVTSGLPGSGKSTFARAVEADGGVRLSVEDAMDRGVERGTAVQECKERLRVALREGRDVVWDATMVTRPMRGGVLGIGESYGARTRIVSVEVPESERHARNAARREPVPDAAVVGMIRSWDVPTYDEALDVEGRPQPPTVAPTLSAGP